MTRLTFDEIVSLLKAAPSDTYRLGDPDFDRRRALFYSRCAMVFGFEGWSISGEYQRFSGEPGRDGQTAKAEKYGDVAKASYWNFGAGTVEIFERQSNLLNSEIEPPYTDIKRDQSAFEGNTRRRVARQLRDLFDGEMVSAMKSADLEATPGGSFGGKVASDHALDCQAKVHRMRKEIPPMCMSILETVLRQEKFIWQVEDRKKMKRILQDIRLALDFAAWSLGSEVRGRQEVDQNELCRRWELAQEWFRQRILRPATHNGRVVRRSNL